MFCKSPSMQLIEGFYTFEFIGGFMERIKNNIFFNLSNTMLKIIGLVCMTIDHLYLYVFANTTINVSIFRIVGRIAAPLFSFCCDTGYAVFIRLKKLYFQIVLNIHICICNS